MGKRKKKINKKQGLDCPECYYPTNELECPTESQYDEFYDTYHIFFICPACGARIKETEWISL